MEFLAPVVVRALVRSALVPRPAVVASAPSAAAMAATAMARAVFSVWSVSHVWFLILRDRRGARRTAAAMETLRVAHGVGSEGVPMPKILPRSSSEGGRRKPAPAMEPEQPLSRL